MNQLSIKKSAYINVVFKLGQIVMLFVFQAILARLISPTEFGLFAIVSVFTSLFSLIADMGVGVGIIQNKELSDEDFNNIYTLTGYIAVVLSILFIGFSFMISYIYGQDVLVCLGSLLSISLLFSTLNMVPNAKLMKEMNFAIIGLRTFTANLLSYFVAVILAYLGFKYYALVLQSIIMSIIIFLFNVRKSNLKLVMRMRLDSIQKIFAVSAYQFLFNITNYFARNLDNLLVGKVMGETVLGFYDKAYRLMLYPVQILTFTVNPILHPILSEFQNEKKLLYDKYRKVVKVLSLSGVFFGVFCFFASEEIVLLLFGKQWIQVIPCFKALSISIWAQLVASSAGAAYQSLGNTKLMFKSGKIHISALVFLIVVGIFSLDIVILSYMVSFGLIIKFFIEYWYLIKKGFETSLLYFFFDFLPELIIAIILVIGMLCIDKLTIDSNYLASGLIKTTVCTLLFIISLIATKQHVFLLDFIPINFHKKK